MEIFNEKGYKIIFLYNEHSLNILVKDVESKIEKKAKLKSVKVEFKNFFKKYFGNFKDLIEKIKQKNILIKVEEQPNENKVDFKFLNLNFIANFGDNLKIIISKKINKLNVEYYLTYGPNNQRLNLKPFNYYLTKEYFNSGDIFELIDKDKTLNFYEIDSYRYFDNTTKTFKKINNENISIGKKIILEFHFNSIKNYFINDLNLAKKYIHEEIINLKNKINKIDDITKKYDLIYLFASPIIDNKQESNSPISYLEEIRIIINLMKNSKKKFYYKFECIDQDLLRRVIYTYKTKILHISAHGMYDGNYSLVVENLKKNGERQDININILKLILNEGRINLSHINLVIISTCYSEDFGKEFIKCGVKNVIYIKELTEVIDKISIIFVKYFYKYLIQGETIEQSYKNTIREMKSNNKEIILLKNSFCCCNHYHEPNCILEDEDDREIYHSDFHSKFSEKCNCDNEKPNYHDKNCEYYTFLKENLDYKSIKEENNKL